MRYSFFRTCVNLLKLTNRNYRQFLPLYFFTAILNNRLNNYLESMNLFCEEQAGFRKKYGTTDHILNLKCIIDLYLFRGKKTILRLY